ncbi:S-adenosyl-L-methionine-dependent methyltransferase [Fragilariopsis cylindrus CCMP1102]|uniref:S-adenosyl-L-methionine-dependent methyltransferase n=1 Tax=Fragilariopsis cylindrus CCMP1102 TaxID=635003 RepID=A0A1E7FLJ5_9STRA|nr:S-adenosyl-L-methionine-dependent methyltransferase [Fragilariopsis cylindrus CCMP1102]|eukprot:OEU19039.1 S-adenosyl-L-methionine-dependent methyltransferase [Fragilariopsis cylindrus CCMP1102]
MIGASFYAAATIIYCTSATFHTGAVTAFALKQQQQTVPTANSNVVHTPVGKDGDGAYSAATKGCFDVIDAATPLILNEVACQPIRDDHPFHIADYGTADGGTSLGLLTKIVKAVRERKGDNNNDSNNDDEKEIVIHYEDQRENEWKSVFNHAFGYKKVTDAYGNQIDTPYDLGNVFIEANGVGFHSQCYPSKSIDLGVSFTAMHWLSSSPSSLRGVDIMHSARSVDGPPPQAEQKQAEQDWYNILCARSKELTKGGRFVCVNFCVSKEGYFLGQTDTGVSMWDSFQIAWNKLAGISEEERLGISFPSYYRTTDEFINGIDKCPDLRLISAEEKIVRCPYREQYIAQSTSDDNKNSKTMTPGEYSKSFVPTTRTWSHSTFKAALSDDKTDQEKEDILEQFWTNYEELVAEAPEEHGMDYVHSYLVIEKI